MNTPLPTICKNSDACLEQGRAGGPVTSWGLGLRVLWSVLLQADMEFVDILASVRTGSCSMATVRALQQRCSSALDVSDGILPTKVSVPATVQSLPIARL